MNFYPFAKTALIIFLGIYSIIAIVVIKQINLMSSTIKSDSNKYLYMLSFLHLFIVLGMLAFAIFVL